MSRTVFLTISVTPFFQRISKKEKIDYIDSHFNLNSTQLVLSLICINNYDVVYFFYTINWTLLRQPFSFVINHPRWFGARSSLKANSRVLSLVLLTNLSFRYFNEIYLRRQSFRYGNSKTNSISTPFWLSISLNLLFHYMFE